MFKIALCEDFPSILSKYIDQNHCSNKSVAYLTLIWWSILERVFFSCEFFWILIGTFAWLLLVKIFKTDTTYCSKNCEKSTIRGNHTLLFAKISIFFFFQTEWFPKGGKWWFVFHYYNTYGCDYYLLLSVTYNK